MTAKLHIERRDARKILGGVPERTFAKLEADGVIVAMQRGRGRRSSLYDLRVIVPAYVAHVSSQKVGDDRAARARRDDAQAKLHELRLARERGELIRRAPTIAEARTIVHAAKARLLALPHQLEQHGACTAEGKQLAEGIVREALEELSRWSLYEPKTA